MLEDRDYMRQPEYNESRWTPRFRFQWSWTVVLLVAYAVVFVANNLVLAQFFPHNDFFVRYLALSTEGIEHGYVWQLVTYQFLHVGWMHILLNSWAIYMFGRELEAMLGGKKFLALVFSSGIVGGVFQVLVALVWPQYFGGPVVGASACAFGLVAAFAMMFPERELTLLIFFVIPVHLRAKTLLIGSAVLALTGFAFPNTIMPGVAHAAHLGGMAMGWFFVRKILQGDWSQLEGTLRPAEKFTPRRPVLEPLAEKPAAGFVESEVDPILDKISAHGLQSLTPREREILEAARKHIKRA
ncbi:MAG TPA: rhomboid family intramembrane serine protease [Verrucomicrobiae bacterium]